MNLKELNNWLRQLPAQVMDDVGNIVAETATEHFKESFTRKAFNGNPWAPANNPRKNGSLLIDSGALVNSIHPSYIGPDKVVISAGNEKVSYAKAHNEGVSESIAVPAHQRKSKKGKVHQVKAHTKEMNLPKREFMGDSSELNKAIHTRVEKYVRLKLKK